VVDCSTMNIKYVLTLSRKERASPGGRCCEMVRIHSPVAGSHLEKLKPGNPMWQQLQKGDCGTVLEPKLARCYDLPIQEDLS
jgi:hypothetical protein